MKHKRYSDKQTFYAMRQAEADGKAGQCAKKSLCRKQKDVLRLRVPPADIIEPNGSSADGYGCGF